MPNARSEVKRKKAAADAGVREERELGFEERLQKQVESEYKQAWDFMRPKISEWLLRLKLYNNQARDKTLVGDPHMFTIHQTFLSALYEDRMVVEFGHREEGDEDVAENLNVLAEFDSEEAQMDLATHDYEWDFDATAFGRGLSYFNEFDTKTKTPIPVVWDPVTFIRDPDAVSVHGNKLGEGAMRFGGREVVLSIDDIKNNPEYFDIDQIKDGNTSDQFSLIFEARQARHSAQGRENSQALQNIKGKGTILQWFTVFEGVKYLTEWANGRKKLIRIHEFEDGEWPLVDRACFPIPHDWDGANVWDFTEDKQRFRAALINIFGDAARADLYAMRLYDKTKMPRDVDKNYKPNKWIGVDGPPGDAVQTLAPGGNAFKAMEMLKLLDLSSQKALATPEMSQGVPQSQERTLGELNLVSTGVESRKSLTVKVWGPSESRRWRRWYNIYQRDFKSGIYQKTARLMGAFGPELRKMTRETIIMSNPLGPDIKIESRAIAEARKLRTFQAMGQLGQDVLMLPNADRTYFVRKRARLLFPKDEVDRMIPPSIDEMQAREENKKLDDDESVRAMLEEDHITHLRVHAAAKDSESKNRHIAMHRYFLMQKRKSPSVFPMLPSDIQPEMNRPSPPKLQAPVAPEGVSPS